MRLYNENRGSSDSGTYMIIALIVIVILGGIVFSCLANVPVGYAGLTVDSFFGGGVSTRPVIGPRTFIKSPLVGLKRIKYTTAFLIFGDNESNADYGTIYCFSSEGIELGMDITVRYSIDPNLLSILYENYPAKNWELTTISSIAQETIRFVVKDYSWQQVRDQRDLVASQIEQEIIDALNSEESLGAIPNMRGGAIIGVEVDLKNVAIPQNLVDAVVAKVTAQQHVMEAEYKRTITLIEANTIAEAQIIDAKADAEARRYRAIGEREAIEEIIDLVGPEGWETFYRMQKLKEIAQFLDNGEATVILPIDTTDNAPALIVDNTPN